MTRQLIYLDTTIWNVLSDQNVDGAAACQRLAEHDLEITLGLNAYFEMLKSFYGKRPDASARGKRLFACLRQFLTNGVRILKTWEELLIQESRVSENGVSVDPFCDKRWHSMLLSAATDLATGRPHVGTRELMLKRDAQSENVRDSASKSIFSQPRMISDLRSVEPADLREFLDKESRGALGRRLLARYLSQIFPMFGQELPGRPKNLQEDSSTQPRIVSLMP